MAFGDEQEAFRTYARTFPGRSCCCSTPTTPSRAPGTRPRWRRSWRPRASRSRRAPRLRRPAATLARGGAGHPRRGRAARTCRSSRPATSTSTGSPRCWPPGAPIDAFGVGHPAGHQRRPPSLGVVYKLVEDAERPEVKLRPGKVTLPGRKQVWRVRRRHDVVIALADEDRPAAAGPLLQPVMSGRRPDAGRAPGRVARAGRARPWPRCPPRCGPCARGEAARRGRRRCRAGLTALARSVYGRDAAGEAPALMSARRLGVFGGTFDPPHVGHLVMAVNVAPRRWRSTGCSWWWPTARGRRSGPARHPGRRPLRHGGGRRAGRSTASRPAPGDRPAAACPTRPTRWPTLQHGGSRAELFVILGSDAAAGLPTWERADEVRPARHHRGRHPARGPGGRAARRAGRGSGSRSPGSRCRAPTSGPGSPTGARSTTCSPPRSSPPSRPGACTATGRTGDHGRRLGRARGRGRPGVAAVAAGGERGPTGSRGDRGRRGALAGARRARRAGHGDRQRRPALRAGAARPARRRAPPPGQPAGTELRPSRRGALSPGRRHRPPRPPPTTFRRPAPGAAGGAGRRTRSGGAASCCWPASAPPPWPASPWP